MVTIGKRQWKLSIFQFYHLLISQNFPNSEAPQSSCFFLLKENKIASHLWPQNTFDKTFFFLSSLSYPNFWSSILYKRIFVSRYVPRNGSNYKKIIS